MALIDKASLLMVPSTYEDGTLYNVLPSGNKAPDETGNHNAYDQTRADFTFSRGSNLAATRVNANGLIEKGRENLLLQSNQFDTTWANSNISLFSGQSGYDKTNNAWNIKTNSSYGPHRVLQSVSLNGVNSISVYAKANGYNYIAIYEPNNGGKFFDLINGVVGNTMAGTAPLDANIETIGDGWYRCSISCAQSTTSVELWLSEDGVNHVFTGDGTSGVYIMNAQAELGLVATDYIETGATTATAGVLENTPRIDYSSGAGALLLEPSRTQLVGYSEYFDGSYWPKADVTIENNATTSPQGKLNASKFVASATNANHLLNKTGFLSVTSGDKYTFSIFAKAAEYDFIRLQFQTGPFPVNYANFDLTNGTIGLNTGATDTKIESVGNGWYKCVLVVTATSTGNSGLQPFVLDSDRTGTSPSYLGDGTSGIYIWGAQLEQGSYATSYVPTYGSAATRGADSCSVTGVSDVIGQTEGTLFVEFEYSNNSVGVVSIHSGNIGNRIYIGTDLNGLISQVRVGYVQQAFFSTPLTIGTTYKCAIAYKANDFALYVNGSQIGTDTSGSVPSSMIKFGFESGAGGDVLNQPTKQTILFNERLSNSELATLTTL